MATTAPDANTQISEARGSREALATQQGRQGRVMARAEKVHYTKTFDLSGLPRYEPSETITGTLSIWGLNYLTDGQLGGYWEAAFKRFHPEATFEYFTPTALVAIPGLYTKLADIGVSRHITFDELLAFQRTLNYHPLEIAVVTGSYNVPGWAPATTIVVHPDNPLNQISFRQLDGIFGAERTGGWKGTAWLPDLARGPEMNIRTWGQLGLTGEWADKEIIPYGRPLKYHQQLHIEEKVFGGGDKWNERLKEYAHYESGGSTALSTQELLNDLSNDRYGIAYSNLGYPAAAKVKTLALARTDDGPFVEISLESVQDHSYPLASHEFFYLRREPGTDLDPKVREYVRFVLSREGQQEVMRDGKFLPLTAEIAREQLGKLD